MRRRIDENNYGPTTTRHTVYGREGDEEEDQQQVVAHDAGIDVKEGGKSLGAIQSDNGGVRCLVVFF